MMSFKSNPILGQPSRARIRDRWWALVLSGTAALAMVVLVMRPKRSIQTGASVQHKYESYPSSWRLEFRETETLSQEDTTKQQSTASFTIMQIADIHLGEAPSTDWGPAQDNHTFYVLDTILSRYEHPDLIVLSGDQLTANDHDTKIVSHYYQRLGEALSYHGIVWALIFGNHDDANYERILPNGTKITKPALTSRQELLAVDQQFPLSLTQSIPNLFGASNYELDAYLPSHWERDKSGSHNDVALQLFFLDSGGGSLHKRLDPNQIQWFQQHHQPDIPGAAVFQHIPTTDFSFDGTRCHGLHDDGIDALEQDPGIVQTLQQAKNVQWLAVGHEHGNDYCCNIRSNTTASGSSNLHLCFGRHSGYGGYGKWERGVRMYQVNLTRYHQDDGLSLTWKSWVRLESGEIEHAYEPFHHLLA